MKLSKKIDKPDSLTSTIKGIDKVICRNVSIIFKICSTFPVISSQLTFTCSNSTIEALEKGVKYVKS